MNGVIVPLFRHLVVYLKFSNNWAAVGVSVYCHALVLCPSHGSRVRVISNLDLNVRIIGMSLREEVNLTIKMSLHGENELVLESTLWLQRVILHCRDPILDLLLKEGKHTIKLIEMGLRNLKDKLIVCRVKLLQRSSRRRNSARIPSQSHFIPLLTCENYDTLRRDINWNGGCVCWECIV